MKRRSMHSRGNRNHVIDSDSSDEQMSGDQMNEKVVKIITFILFEYMYHILFDVLNEIGSSQCYKFQ